MFGTNGAQPLLVRRGWEDYSSMKGETAGLQLSGERESRTTALWRERQQVYSSMGRETEGLSAKVPLFVITFSQATDIISVTVGGKVIPARFFIDW